MLNVSVDTELATILLAATCKKKWNHSVRRQIQSVDVPATCDKIRAALLSQPRNTNQTQLLHSEENACALSGHLPFRMASKLCFHTIAVYKQQVDQLVELTQDLMFSSKLAQPILLRRAGKRKCINDKSQGGSSAKRLCSSIITSYDQLVQEAEELQKWSQSVSQASFQQQYSERTSSLKHMHIREITVREITVALETGMEGSDDEDFGHATADELCEILTGFSDSQFLSGVENRLKRTAAVLPLPQPKRRFMSAAAEIADSGCCDTTPSVLNSPGEVEHGTTDSPCNEPSFFMKKASPQPVAMPPRRIKPGSKLLVDQFIQLSANRMRSQISHHMNLQRMRRHAPYPSRSRVAAAVLLRRLNKRNCFLFKSSKQEITRLPALGRKRILYDHMSLMASILGRSAGECIDDDTHDVGPPANKKNLPHSPSQCLAGNDDHLTIEHSYAGIVLKREVNCNSNSNIYNNNNNGCDVKAAGNSMDTAKEHAYSIMMELLHIWQTTPERKEINARRFCWAKGRRDDASAAAVAFYALLVLVAGKFISLTKQRESIQVRGIRMGPASEQLIHDVHRTRCLA